MTELEYLRGRVAVLETLLVKALPVLRLAVLYPTLVARVEKALGISSPVEEPVVSEAKR
jgi:hypothetical protein